MLPVEIKNLHKNRYLAVQSRSGIFPDNWEYIYEVQFVAPQKYNKERTGFLRNSRGYFTMDNFATGGALPEGSLPRKDIDDKGIYDPFADDFFALAGRHGIKVILITMYEMEGREKEEGINVTFLQEWQALKSRFKNISFAKEGLIPRYYRSNFFVDPYHLNSRGAADYTREIARQFREVSAGLKNKADN